jgi:adenosine kinase
VDIPAAPAVREADPTGAGDAYRAGLVAGLLRGLDVYAAGCIGSLAATHAVEHIGTIEHRYTRDEFCARHLDCFGSEPAAAFWG